MKTVANKIIMMIVLGMSLVGNVFASSELERLLDIKVNVEIPIFKSLETNVSVKARYENEAFSKLEVLGKVELGRGERLARIIKNIVERRSEEDFDLTKDEFLDDLQEDLSLVGVENLQMNADIAERKKGLLSFQASANTDNVPQALIHLNDEVDLLLDSPEGEELQALHVKFNHLTYRSGSVFPTFITNYGQEKLEVGQFPLFVKEFTSNGEKKVRIFALDIDRKKFIVVDELNLYLGAHFDAGELVNVISGEIDVHQSFDAELYYIDVKSRGRTFRYTPSKLSEINELLNSGGN